MKNKITTKTEQTKKEISKKIPNSLWNKNWIKNLGSLNAKTACLVTSVEQLDVSV